MGGGTLVVKNCRHSSEFGYQVSLCVPLPPPPGDLNRVYARELAKVWTHCPMSNGADSSQALPDFACGLLSP